MFILNNQPLIQEVVDVFLRATPPRYKTQIVRWVSDHWMERYEPSAATYEEGVEVALQNLDKDGFCVLPLQANAKAQSSVWTWKGLKKRHGSLARVGSTYPRLTAAQAGRARAFGIANTGGRTWTAGGIIPDEIHDPEINSLGALGILCVWVETWSGTTDWHPVTWEKYKETSLDTAKLGLRDLAPLIVHGLTDGYQRETVKGADFSTALDRVDTLASMWTDRNCKAADSVVGAEVAKNRETQTGEQYRYTVIWMKQLIEKEVQRLFIARPERGRVLAQKINDVVSWHSGVGMLLRNQFDPLENVAPDVSLWFDVNRTIDVINATGREYNPPLRKSSLGGCWADLSRFAFDCAEATATIVRKTSADVEKQ